MSGDHANGVLVSTTFELPGYVVERTFGVAWGLIVRSVGVAKGLVGGCVRFDPVRWTSTRRWSTAPGVPRWNA